MPEFLIFYNVYDGSTPVVSTNKLYVNYLYRTDRIKASNNSLVGFTKITEETYNRYREQHEHVTDEQVANHLYRRDEFIPIHKYGRAELFHRMDHNTFKIVCFGDEKEFQMSDYDSYFVFLEECKILRLEPPENLLIQ